MIDYENFWRLAEVVELRPSRLQSQAELASSVSLDDSLCGRAIVFLFRFPRSPELRVSSTCTVRHIEERFRNKAGVAQTRVVFERADGSVCEFGLNLENYWQREFDDMDYLWLVLK